MTAEERREILRTIPVEIDIGPSPSFDKFKRTILPPITPEMVAAESEYQTALSALRQNILRAMAVPERLLGRTLTAIAGENIGSPERPCVPVYIGKDGKAYEARGVADDADEPAIIDIPCPNG